MLSSNTISSLNYILELQIEMNLVSTAFFSTYLFRYIKHSILCYSFKVAAPGEVWTYTYPLNYKSKYRTFSLPPKFPLGAFPIYVFSRAVGATMRKAREVPSWSLSSILKTGCELGLNSPKNEETDAKENQVSWRLNRWQMEIVVEVRLPR